MNEQQVLEEIERTLGVLGEISHQHEAQEPQEPQEETPPLPQGERGTPPSSYEHSEQQEQMVAPIIHIYVVDAPPPLVEEDERTIESTLEAAEEADSLTGDESEPRCP